MDKNTVKQVFMLVITATLIYVCGLHITTIGELTNLFDGFVIIVFFFALFPFLSLSTNFTIKFLKRLLKFKNS